MVNPIFGVDVSGIQWRAETTEGTYVTGAYQFVAPELRSTWQAAYQPYPVNALGDTDIADFNVGRRMDSSRFTFDITTSGLQYLKYAINKGSSSTTGAWWSQSYIGRVYSQSDADLIYWTASGARIARVAIGPGTASWQAQVDIVHKPPTISGVAPANATFVEWPGASTDPVLNPQTVTSGALFTWNAVPWYLADIGFSVSHGVVPVPVLGSQNVSKFNNTVRDITVMAAPYEPNLQTYLTALNTVGTGVLTLVAGRTVTFTGLYWYGVQQLPFNPTRPATVALVGAARAVALA